MYSLLLPINKSEISIFYTLYFGIYIKYSCKIRDKFRHMQVVAEKV